MYTLEQLQETFNLISNNVYQGVKGCWCIDSNTEGPVVGITILTHGNEPSGLAAFRHFVENSIVPISGKIIFLVNNVLATEQFFNAITEGEKDACRFIDINFNRLPDNCLEIFDDNYETRRIKEVYPVYRLFDFGLDIHSTRVDPVPSIINISDDLDHGLFAGFPDEMVAVVANMANVQSGIPASRLFGGRDRKIPVLGIETGIHEGGASYNTAIKCTEAFCANCGVLPVQIHQPRKYDIYEVARSVCYPHKSFATVRDFTAFEEVTTNTLLAENETGDKIYAPISGHSLFGNKKGHKPKTTQDEEFFITQPPYSKVI